MSEGEIRSVIIPLTQIEILIPNATVAEVTNYVEPQAIPDTAPWMLGTFLWRGWQVPLISFAVLAEVVERENIDNARICVTKSLIDNPRMPYLAILAQAFPRLHTITATELVEVPTSSNPLAVAGRAIVNEHEVIVPELDLLGHLVAHAAFGALPVSHRRPL